MATDADPAFLARVREWNQRHQHDGWRSSSDTLPCPQCGGPQAVYLTTINGETRAGCVACRHTWVIEA